MEKDRKKILEDAKHLGLPIPDEKNQQDKKPLSEITAADIYRADAGTAAKFQDDYDCDCGCGVGQYPSSYDRKRNRRD